MPIGLQLQVIFIIGVYGTRLSRLRIIMYMWVVL